MIISLVLEERWLSLQMNPKYSLWVNFLCLSIAWRVHHNVFAIFDVIFAHVDQSRWYLFLQQQQISKMVQPSFAKLARFAELHYAPETFQMWS